jgi:hypothetical protein
VTLTTPTLSDFVLVCHHLPAEQRYMFKALGGFPHYDADAVALELAARNGPKWALIHDGTHQPIGIGGLTCIAPGVWSDFLITVAGAWRTYPNVITRHVRRALVAAFATDDVRRVQAITLASAERVRAWYRLIGFEYEGCLRAYAANGEDAVIYARVKP